MRDGGVGFAALFMTLLALLGFFFFEVQLIYSIVPISAVQQSDSVTHIQTFFFLTFFFITVYHGILNIVPCALQQDLVIHPSFISLHLLIPNSQSFPPPPASPLATTSLISMSVSLFPFCRQVHLCPTLDSTRVISYGICLSLSDLLHLV